MKYMFTLARKNILRRPFRSAALTFLVMILSFTVFFGAMAITGLRRGLDSYRARLGADVVVVPSSTVGHGNVDDILLQGITGNYYIKASDLEKVEATEGIDAVSRQFFLTSAKAGCCSARVQMIGFDPETDFSIRPWIRESYKGEITDGDLVVGADINVPADRTLKFYGQVYRVAARLERTGTGLDNAVYTNMNTIRQMADNARLKLTNSSLNQVDTATAASALMIQVKEGYKISDVVDDINIHITGVQASSSRSMVYDIAEGLGNVSRLISLLAALIWLLAVGILFAVFALLANERKKEFAVLRTVGASRSMIFGLLAFESIMEGLAGSILGLLAAGLILYPVSGMLKNALKLPLLMPGPGLTAGLAAAALILSAACGLAASLLTANRIAGKETGFLLREDA